MAFDATSRYYKVEDATLVVSLPGGTTRTLSYKLRRFIAPPASPSSLTHVPLEGERPDQLSARFLGDPTQFWRICDANQVLRPAELTDVAGRRIIIPVVGP
jgi:hypothetical protein